MKKINVTFLLLLVSYLSAFSQLPVINGWTQFTVSPDTRIIYVSDVDGNDATAEFYAPGDSEVGSDPFLPSGTVQPYRTIDAAKAVLRDGFPDWILLKKGDVFINQHFGLMNINGKNASEPMLIGSYGVSTERPRILTGSNNLISFTGAASHIAISGLYAEPHTRAGSDEPSAINILNAPFHSFLVEDCYFNLFCIHIVVQDYSGSSSYSHSGFTARRNTIVNGYQTGGGGGGVYMHHIDNILFEENLIDHNGWSTTISGADATGFSHNTYFQSSCSNLTFKDNIVSRASAVGIGARCGGIIENNLALSNPRNLFIGSFDPSQINWPTEGVSGEVKHNVILGARIEPYDLGNGITIDRVRNVEISENVVAHFTETGTYNTAIGLDHIEDVAIRQNIIYRWGNNQTSGFDFAAGLQFGTNKQGVMFIDSNDIQLENPLAYCVNTNGSFSNLTFRGNRYHNVVNAPDWFAAGNYTSWVTASGETGSLQLDVTYPDPERNISTYLTSIGETGGLEEFITLRKQLSKNNWDSRFTAMTVNDYIREGFGVAPLNTVSLTAISSPSDILLYPNPVQGGILTIESAAPASYLICDQVGRTVQSGQLEKGKQHIDLNALKNGSYLIRINEKSAQLMINH